MMPFLLERVACLWLLLRLSNIPTLTHKCAHQLPSESKEEMKDAITVILKSVLAHGYLFSEKVVNDEEESSFCTPPNTSDEEEDMIGSQTITYFEGNGERRPRWPFYCVSMS
jgi:hypothetical protein